jgi:putative transposase
MQRQNSSLPAALPITTAGSLEHTSTNAFAERWIGTLRRECLDRMLIFSERHLLVVVREYVTHYNVHRPHRSVGQRSSEHSHSFSHRDDYITGYAIERKEILGGLINEYQRAA